MNSSEIGLLTLCFVAGDGAALTSRPSISSHDPDFGPSKTARGNLTRTAQWFSTSTTGSCIYTLSGFCINEFEEYDIAGNLTRVVDPRGNATNLNYDDRFGSPDGEARSNSAPAYWRVNLHTPLRRHKPMQ
jgi:hypothetical protein